MNAHDTCPLCGSGFTHRVRNYPVNNQGKTLQVQGVSLWECDGCGFLLPDEEGGEKVGRFILDAGIIEGAFIASKAVPPRRRPKNRP